MNSHSGLGTAFIAVVMLTPRVAAIAKVHSLPAVEVPRPRNDAVKHYNLGNALYDKGDLEGAIAEYRTAISQQPNSPQVHNNLGNALHDKGDLAGAITEYRTAISQQPNYPLAHNNLGSALREKSDLEGAIAEFRNSHPVIVSWFPSTSTVSGYNVFRSTVSGRSYRRLNSSPVTTTEFTDSTVQPGQTYFYVVTAVDSNGVESTYSNQATAHTPLNVTK